MVKRIEYTNNKKITATQDDAANNAIWVAFEQDSDGNVIFKRQSGFNPEQTFYTLTREVDKLVAMDIDSDNIYVAYEDSVLLGEILDTNNPLSSQTDITIPVGITEFPVDVSIDDVDLYYLIPGSATGTNTKIIRYDTDGIFQEIIDLNKTGLIINNAISIAPSGTGDLWLGINEDPSTIVRVFPLTGGGFDFEEFLIT